jgi:polygalacturonase
MAFCAALLLLVPSSRAGTPTLPSINTNNIINVTSAPYNAVGNGTTDDTSAIQAAILQAGKGGTTNGAAGGTVKIPGPGTYLCGPISLTNSVNLEIDSGATLLMLPIASYPGGSSPPDFITVNNFHDVEISGSGIINGQADFSGWWNGLSTSARPYMIMISKAQRLLIQNVTLENAPKMHIAFKSSGANITIQGMTINTAGNSPNTDGIDLIGTNVLIQNCSISDGDDNIALGSSSSGAVSSDTLVTNCFFGTGHGMSIGGNTLGGVSNLTVINCTFNGTVYGIRLKSDNLSSGGGGEGGIAQNLSYLNLTMTNIQDAAIVIYSYYEEYGTPTSITPAFAASQPIPAPVPTTTCVWRNITISNVTASVASGGIAGIIWARTELPATNITFDRVNITASKSFDVYNAQKVAFVDSQITVPGGVDTFEFLNAQMTVTNSSPNLNLITFDGLVTNSLPNDLRFYDSQESLTDTNVIATGPVTLGASTLSIGDDLDMSGSTAFNFTLGTSAATVAVTGNLAMGGTVNVTNGTGFGGGTYTLLTYTGGLSGPLPTLGSSPTGFTYSFKTNVAGQLNLLVTASGGPAAPANLTAVATNLGVNLTWNASLSALSYNLKRSTTNNGPYLTITNVAATNFSDSGLNPGVAYYYVVSATNGTGESANSTQVTATPLPSLASINLGLQNQGGLLKLSWPQDHTGWRVEVQTNARGTGIGTNWTTWSGSTTTNQIFVPFIPTNGSVFLRLAYP